MQEERIEIRIDCKLKEKGKREAKKKDMSFSAWIKYLISKEVKKK